MKKDSKSPSISQIIWTDYTAFIFSLVPIVVWIVYLAWVPSWRKDGPILSPIIAPYFAIVALLLSTAAVLIVVWRIVLIRRILLYGSEVRGRIASVTIRRDRGRVEYTYVFNQKRYRSGTAIHRNKQTLALKNGERVLLMVDQSKPERAFISHIYTKRLG